MKVRPTGYHSTHIDVEEESPSYYITRDGELLSKKGYEPVPEEQWVDVTGQFRENSWSRPDYFISDGPTLALTGSYEGYRIRKITRDVVPGFNQYAFIIEKRTP